MDAVHPDQNGICLDETQVENLLPPDSDVEPEILPRIGDEFQVQLPPLIGESNYLSEADVHTHQNYLMGLPMPLAWISLKHEKSGCDNSSKSTKLDSKDGILEEISFFGSGPSQVSRNPVEAKKLTAAEKMRKCNHANCILVPGSSEDYWSSFETQSFILALYIFEKDFIEVRRFLGTKEVGSLLSFYYGKFYGSQAYRRWSDCRKMKGKKGIYGRRLFSGSRQQELLSRILPRVPEACRNTLVEVSKAFEDENISLASYASYLKSMVGMNILVEAVGIGTGKQDLTAMALEPSRSSQVMRPEIPSGKACSTLTASEIIKFLCGGYRISKARSNDLFWEAVWPRLLARGWHSEQPKDQAYVAGSKNSLVFLIPEVKKFSRRKLVKGNHYFDSVADVLSTVAREPGMIRLENEEEDDGVKKEEYAWTSERKMGTDYIEPPARQKPCFLQPRTPKRSTVLKMKFTVIDTSLSNGNVRQIRSLPFEVSDVSTAQVLYEVRDKDTPEEASAESGTINSIHRKTTAKFDGNIFRGKKDENVDTFHQDSGTVYPHGAAALLLPGLKKKKDFPKNNSKPRELKQNDADYMVPTAKRRRVLSACSEGETNSGLLQAKIGSRTDAKMSSCCSGPQEVTDNSGFCGDKVSSSSSYRGSPIESAENSQTLPLIDLNLPHTFPESENIVFIKEQESTSMKVEDTSLLPESSAAEPEARSQQQANTNPGRHSTRNRPLTSKAMEALVNGYLSVKRRRNSKETNSMISRPSKRARVRVQRGPHETSTNSSLASQVEEAENGTSTCGNVNASAESQVPKQGNEELSPEHYQLENRIVGEKEQSS